MKNEIKELNLMYSLCTNDIISHYSEFKQLMGEELKKISNQINDYFLWLEQQQSINALNVVLIGKELLKQSDVRKQILENNISSLQETSIELLKTIDIEDINSKLVKDEYLFINCSIDEDVELQRSELETFLNNSLENSNLLFRDLIQLLLDNFDFSKNLKKVQFSSGYYLKFISKLNYIYYHLATFLNSSRQDLYYASLWLLQFPYISDMLFPRSYIYCFEKKEIDFETSKLVELGIVRGLHYLNLFYYIEIPDFNYKNSQRNTSYYKNGNDNRTDTLFQYITSVLTIEDKIFLYKIAFIDKNYLLTESDTQKLNNLIKSLKKLDNIIILSQDLSMKKQKLLEDTICYIKEYSKKHNITLFDFVYCPHPARDTYSLYLEFYILHKNFKYKFSIRKYNSRLTWSVYLKNKKIYKINLYLPEDFKHLLQAIYNDQLESEI